MNIDLIETVSHYLDIKDIVRCSILSKSINHSLCFVMKNRQSDKQVEINHHYWCRTCDSKVDKNVQYKIFLCACNSFSFFHSRCISLFSCPVCFKKPTVLTIHNNIENGYMKPSKY